MISNRILFILISDAVYFFFTLWAAVFLFKIKLKPDSKKVNLLLLSLLILTSFIFKFYGARLSYFAMIPQDFFNAGKFLYKEFFAFMQGPLNSWGIFIGTIAYAFLISPIVKIKSLKILDWLYLAMPLSIAIRRLTCLFDHCCQGILIAEGTKICRFLHVEELIHPFALYLSLANLFIFYLLIRLYKSKDYIEGSIFSSFFILYLNSRFFIEYFREEANLFFIPIFNLPQFICLSILPIFFAVHLMICKKRTNL